jgi:hypothetical protein
MPKNALVISCVFKRTQYCNLQIYSFFRTGACVSDLRKLILPKMLLQRSLSVKKTKTDTEFKLWYKWEKTRVSHVLAIHFGKRAYCFLIYKSFDSFYIALHFHHSHHLLEVLQTTQKYLNENILQWPVQRTLNFCRPDTQCKLSECRQHATRPLAIIS